MSDHIQVFKPRDAKDVKQILSTLSTYCGEIETDKGAKEWIKMGEMDLTNHPTEEKYPEMCTRFREIQEEMYKVFLDKNMDYSPYNINGTGIVGLCTRFWDKTARIMHLIGFDIGTGIYTGIRKNTVEDEPIEKTFIDGSNYGIIARIWLEGKWGK